MRLAAANFGLLAVWSQVTWAGFILRAWDVADLYSEPMRVWAGDGKTYVGDTIPPDVKVAFNFTVVGDRRDLMYLETDKEASKAGSPTLASPSFMVANAAVNSSDSFYLAHSAVDLTHQNIFIFAAFEGFWYPATRAGIAPGGTYLVPTSVKGTYSVRWIVNATTAATLKGRPATFATR